MPEITDAAAPQVRSYTARIDDIDGRTRSLVATINTGSLDRYRTVIDPRGIDCRRYLQNRVVMWSHGQDPQRGEMPIGRNEWVRVVAGPDGPELRAKTVFFSGKKGDDFTERLWECYRDGDMRAWSVRVLPKPAGCGPPTADEIRARPELADCWMMYRSTELGEYSAVAVGGNADALSDMSATDARSVLACVSRGLALPADLVARAEQLVAGGEGEGDPAEAPPRPAIAADPVLPPLGGRPYAGRRAEVLGQVRAMMAAFAAEARMHADFRRGRV